MCREEGRERYEKKEGTDTPWGRGKLNERPMHK